jgi:L-asparaginase
VRVAVSPDAAGKGTLVVLAGQVLAARDVSKTHTQHLSSFKSLELGPLGIVDEDEVRFYREPLRRQTLASRATLVPATVEIVMHYAGADGNVIRGLLNQPSLDGLVVAGTGVGNVSSLMYDAIAEVRERGIPVVMSTRVHTGRVIPLHTSKGRGKSLKEIGVVFADNLSPQKARVLLMLAVRETTNPDKLQRIFDGESF